MEKEIFRKTLYKDKLKTIYALSQCKLSVLFDWFDNSGCQWAYGSQHAFLMCVREIVNSDGQYKNFDSKKSLSEAAIRKRYQRHRSISPEQRFLLIFKQRQIAERKNSEIRNSLFSYSPIENFQLGYEEKLLWQDKTEQITKSVYEEINRIYRTTVGYTLYRTDLTAHGLWINYELSQYLLDNMLSSEFPCKIPVEDLLQIKENQGLFFVFPGSQMSKFLKSTEKEQQHILLKRQEIINSGIVEDQENFYVFKNYYGFTSPSLAASVLTGVNINGKIYWRDEKGKTFKELHPNFEKIKRGPGRPKKSS